MFVFERQQNDVVLRRPIVNEAIMDHVPAAVYSITMTDEGIKLRHLRKQFTVPEKIYGKHEKYKNAILGNFKSEKGSTGVLLVGNKGCGKSLLAEDISNNLIAQGYPIIYVESTLPVGLLADVIRGIGPCGVVFEEFGKVYQIYATDRPDQNDLLTLFSDSSLQKVLFLMLENSSKNIIEFLLDRPKRVHFKIDYTLDYYEEFQEIWGNVPLSEEIDQFVTVYLRSFRYREFEGGWDVLFALAKILKEEKSLKDVIDRIGYTNIPRPVTCDVIFAGLYLRKDPITGQVFLEVPGQDQKEICLQDLALEALKKGIYVTNEYTLTVNYLPESRNVARSGWMRECGLITRLQLPSAKKKAHDAEDDGEEEQEVSVTYPSPLGINNNTYEQIEAVQKKALENMGKPPISTQLSPWYRNRY